MKRLMAGLSLSLLWLVLPPVALARQATPPPSVNAETRDQFADLSRHIREQMEPGGRFEFVDRAEHDTVTRDLAAMQALFDRFGRVDAMDRDAKIALYNSQSEVNAILTQRDGEREICTHEMPTGSNIPTTRCRKYSDIERNRKDTLKAKQDMLQVQSYRVPSGPGH